MRKTIQLTLACMILLLQLSQAQNNSQSLQIKNKILWDTYGVPHVYAGSVAGMYYGFGWSQMHSHASLLLQLYGEARGKAAEYWGERYLMLDKKILSFDVPSIADKMYTKQNAFYKTYLDAFAKGINDYAAAHPEDIDTVYRQVLPVKPQDVLAHGVRVCYLEFLAPNDIGDVSHMIMAGSNAYAVAPSRSANGHALLLANPHLPWEDLFIFYEAHLKAPGFNAYGATLIGFPMLAIAFNEHLGWTHTVNTIDGSDKYELTLKDDGYLLDGKKEMFSDKPIMIRVKKDDGGFREESFIIRSSKHGSVLGTKNGKAYAVRIAGIDHPDIFYEWHRMAAATSRKDFESALRMMQLPMFNVVYADDKGNIAYNFAGNVPVRDTGDWRLWHSNIDGTRSKFIWNAFHSYEQLPRLVNPATGFLQNANDPPWTCTYPTVLKPDNYPAYMSPLEMDLRPQRAVNMIKDQKAITLQQLIDDKFNTGMEAADRLVPLLIEAAGKYGDSLAQKAAEVLKQWDRKTDSSSSGALLFMRWAERNGRDPFAEPWNFKHPVETPSGLKDPQQAVAALDSAARDLIRFVGRMDIPYGQVFRLRSEHFDYAGNGGPGTFGIFRTLHYKPDKDGRFKAIAGDSYIAAVEFGSQVKAKVLLNYSNSSQKGSKHSEDQLKLVSQKQLRDAWFTDEEISQHTEAEEVLKF
ncbi:acylase [Danxiaibacter flavus]|uniref:Acylase n=1 Tax=Danxiaibacter flavus TaxID=3049108 RepID=A0ABV3Z9B6_9BACT|nr:acylase [Chitinophagaceae bacterium DXS]